uniref:Uncharacterized protein n=1 Tax=Naja naja TaxID=35670 RepID=A0A8C6VKQ9_NAJNA
MAAALRRLRGTEVERVRPEPEPPPPLWGMAPFRCAQHRGSGQSAVQGGSQEQPPYPGYAPNYWNSSPRASYSNPYPVGSELQGQGIDSSYTNGVYGPSYPAPGAGPPYPSLPQSNTYYSSEHSPATYSTDTSSIYRTPSSASNWNYPPPDCPAEGSMVRRQVAGYSPPQGPAFPLPPYPYGDCNPNIPQQRPPPPQPGLQDATWQTPGAYGIQPPYGWLLPQRGKGIHLLQNLGLAVMCLLYTPQITILRYVFEIHKGLVHYLFKIRNSIFICFRICALQVYHRKNPIEYSIFLTPLEQNPKF